MPVISNEKPDRLQLFHWGLIPRWVKSKEDALKFRSRTLNARSETVFEKPSFRNAIKTNRCLIPANGFYEWMHYNGKKYPHFIYLQNKNIFSMAGIWEQWVDKQTGEIYKTYSILTTEANPLMAKIHNSKERMPVILPPKNETDWLNNGLSKEDIQSMTVPYETDKMTAHTISKLITSRTENSNVPDVQKQYEYAELAA